jgi:hypothetical protein
MKPIITACLASVLAIGCTGNDKKTEETTASTTDTSAMVATTSDNTTTPPPVAIDSATMMKNWQSYMTPGDAHKMLASWDGIWNGDLTMWDYPGAEPKMTKGTAINKMVLGGRYQMSTHKSTMMGRPFEGIGTVAYDNSKKAFVSTWIDNFGTGIMTMEGPWDEASKTLTLTGKCVNPMMNDGSTMELKEVLKIVNDKNQVMEMYGPDNTGKQFKMMEIKMTKQ